ncbi:hypothetical protein GWK47_023271 [Chionoecetes opilio]|uniref:Uncharacterized protein n=1 Tax=Chionoecetes opilio TaxID=41210 RepID=A0A8J4XMF3_CHIOP|nr:hypothetical protein GWK47_023271 [Chionoecetes opilio]
MVRGWSADSTIKTSKELLVPRLFLRRTRSQMGRLSAFEMDNWSRPLSRPRPPRDFRSRPLLSLTGADLRLAAPFPPSIFPPGAWPGSGECVGRRTVLAFQGSVGLSGQLCFTERFAALCRRWGTPE